MISGKVKLEIMIHAKEEYPRECCGVVTQKGRVQRYHRIDNIHREPEKHFEMDAMQYAEILDMEGSEIISIVHSHTGDGATTLPSAHDTCICNEMGVMWTIVSYPEGDMRFVEPSTLPLIGRPWALGSFDCYGLVMAWHKENGVELLDRRLDFEWWKPDHGINLYQDYYREDGFIEIQDQGNPQYGDMIIMQIGQGVPVWNHAGIYLGDNQILHHAFGKLSRKDIYSGWYQDHTKLIVRHKDLKI